MVAGPAGVGGRVVLVMVLVGWGAGQQDGCRDAGDWKSGRASGVSE